MIISPFYSVDDVYATSEKLLEQGRAFKKKPDEGRMKGLAELRGVMHALESLRSR